jgi:hypothetical protein
MPNPRSELVPELIRVFVAEIDLVIYAVEPEGHGFGRCPSVKVVLEDDLDSLCHGLFPFGYISRG